MKTAAAYHTMTGTVYVKTKNTTIKYAKFDGKAECKWLIAEFSKEYPDFDISVIFNESE